MWLQNTIFPVPRKMPFALESQNRAAAAIEAGYFDSQITPVDVKVKRDMVPFLRDEHPKATTAEGLAGLRPVFQKDGSVTAGNASGINDGAAAIVLATANSCGKIRIETTRTCSWDMHMLVSAPRVMGIGPIPAVENLNGENGSIHKVILMSSRVTRHLQHKHWR
jgi:acetyl-CoA C-acetyltransferase